MPYTYWTCPVWQMTKPSIRHWGSSNETAATTDCNFLDLPRELRDTIFEYTLVSGYHQGEVWLDTPTGDLPYIPPSLLSTCRQIRSEASETFFKKTKFLFEDINNCKRWLQSLSPATRSHIRHLGYCSRYQEAEADPLGDHSAEECLAEIQAYFEAAGLDVRKALRVCNGCSYRFKHQWVGWGAGTPDREGSSVS